MNCECDPITNKEGLVIPSPAIQIIKVCPDTFPDYFSMALDSRWLNHYEIHLTTPEGKKLVVDHVEKNMLSRVQWRDHQLALLHFAETHTLKDSNFTYEFPEIYRYVNFGQPLDNRNVAEVIAFEPTLPGLGTRDLNPLLDYSTLFPDSKDQENFIIWIQPPGNNKQESKMHPGDITFVNKQTRMVTAPTILAAPLPLAKPRGYTLEEMQWDNNLFALVPPRKD